MGRLVSSELIDSRFVPPRNISIWLPREYDQFPQARFPVLYMQDGEKVFRPNTEGSGNWGVPETIGALSGQGQIRAPIVVAIWATENRAGEYMPLKPLLSFPDKAKIFHQAHRGRHYVPRSEEYLQFLVSELKPHIDRRYRTLPDKDNCLLMGSSRGALISIYAVAEFPHIFQGAACLSTHWPHGDGIVIDWLETHLPRAGEHRFYFDYGSEGLDGEYEPYQIRMDTLMLKHGYRKGVDWITRSFPGHGHTEAFWRSRLHIPMSFLHNVRWSFRQQLSSR